MSAGNLYFQTAHHLLEKIESQEFEKIRIVAQAVAQSISAGGILHLFGSGHSAIPAHEVFIRAGSLSCARPVSLEFMLDTFELIEGVGLALMKNFDGKSGEVLVVISNSGANPLPIEVALEGKRRGLFTVAITSFEHSLRVATRHSNGKRLLDVVDIAIDSHVPYGDTGLEINGFPGKLGPLSTIAGVAIINAIETEAIEQLIARGETPPVRISRNIPGGVEHNQQYVDRYAGRIPELRL